MTLSENVSMADDFDCILKNGKVCFYGTMTLNAASSGNMVIFTVKNDYTPVAKYTIFPARKNSNPYDEFGSIWISHDGTARLYGQYNSGQVIYIQHEYTIR